MAIAYFLLLIFVPGFLLLRLLFKRMDVFLVPPTSFVLGLLLMALSALPSYIFSLSWPQSLSITILYSVAMLMLVLRKKEPLFNFSIKFDFITLILLILVVGSTLMMFWIKPHIDGDALFHLSQIRKLAENNLVSATEAIFPIDKVSPAYGYNVWYFAMALIAYISRLDVLTVWSQLIFILVPVSVLSLYTLAYGLFKERLLALGSTIIFFFILGYAANAWEFRLMPYPDQIARHIVLFTSLYFFIKFINERTRLYLVLAVLTGVLLTMVHLFSWVHFLLAIGSFGLFSLFLRHKALFKESLKIVVATILIAAPYLFLKLQSASSVVEEPYLRKAALNLFDGVFVVNPLAKPFIYYLAIVMLMYLVFVYRKLLKNKLWLIFLLSSAFASLFVMFNPLVTPVVAKLITFTFTKRLTSLVYLELIFSAFIFLVVLSARSRLVVDKMFRNVVFIMVISIVILVPFGFKTSYVEDKDEKNVTKLVSYISKNLPAQSVFAADMWTSYRIPAYTNNFIVMTFPNHTTWNVHKPSRMKDLTDIFSPDKQIKEAKILLDKYSVSYVVIKEKPRKNDIIIDQNKFINNKEFSEVYDNGAYKIYSYNKKNK